MAWKFVPSDKFDLPQLLHWEKFYADDLQRAKESLFQLEKMGSKLLKAKNGGRILTNAKNHVKESSWNLIKVKEAIAIAMKNGQ